MIPKIRVNSRTEMSANSTSAGPVVAAAPSGCVRSVLLPCGHVRSRRVTNGWVRPKQVSVTERPRHHGPRG